MDSITTLVNVAREAIQSRDVYTWEQASERISMALWAAENRVKELTALKVAMQHWKEVETMQSEA